MRGHLQILDECPPALRGHIGIATADQNQIAVQYIVAKLAAALRVSSTRTKVRANQVR